MPSLADKYRPTTFSEVRGNDNLKSIIARSLEKKDKPQTYILQGARGCGKTTLARIMAEKLGATGRDLYELNISDMRGIDTARSIIDNIHYMPVEGGSKVIILNECFAKGTMVRTLCGDKRIEEVEIGEKIFNADGLDSVKGLFINKVGINRVIKIILSDKREIYCTKDHRFLTDKGWVEAVNLNKNDFTFKFSCSIMLGIRVKSIFKKRVYYAYRNKEKKIQEMQVLWKKVCLKAVSAQKVLFEQLQQPSKKKISKSSLPKLWEGNVETKKMCVYKNVMFKELCCKLSESATRVQRYINTWREGSNEGITKTDEGKSSMGESFFQKNESKQSDERPKEYREGEKYKTDKWYAAYLERKERRQRAVNSTANAFSFCSGLGNGSGSWFRRKSAGLSNEVYPGYCKQSFKDRHRSRRQRAQIEKDYVEGHKKRGEAKRVRVESVEVYKRGSNDESFKSIIGDKERSQGLVEFYDLEVNNHPSYFVNNTLVHNCHRATVDFQNAMLEKLEEPPPNVYFILCTTEPQKLLSTIISRCALRKYPVKPLRRREMKELIVQTLEAEEVEWSRENVGKIVKVVDGIPREALILLDGVIELKSKRLERALDELVRTDSDAPIDLIRAINKGESWKSIAVILKSLGEDANADDIRWTMLKYMRKVLLNNPSAEVAYTIECFEDSFAESGLAGLYLACYKSLNM